MPAQATWWLQMPEGEIPGGGTADAFLERYLRSSRRAFSIENAPSLTKKATRRRCKGGSRRSARHDASQTAAAVAKGQYGNLPLGGGAPIAFAISWTVETPDYDDSAFDRATFRKKVEDALRELHAERIAVVQHLQRGPIVDQVAVYDGSGDARRIAALATIGPELEDAFAELKREGKVGWLATFPHTPGYAWAAIESGHFHGMVAFFNLLETEMVPLLGAMRERGMGYFAMRPFLQGLITDKRADHVRLPEGDAQRNPEWEPYYGRFARLQEELGAKVGSWSELAVKFTLADPLMPSVILSMNTPEQVESVLAAADGNYPDAAFMRRVASLNGHIA